MSLSRSVEEGSGVQRGGGADVSEKKQRKKRKEKVKVKENGVWPK